MFRAVGDQSVILNLRTELYLGADAVGTAMWNALIGSESIQAAYGTLLQEFDVAPEHLRQDLEDFIQQLLEQGLVELNAGIAAASEGA